MEIIVEKKYVKPYRENVYCKKCRKKLIIIGQLLSSPPQNIYQCEECGEKLYTFEQYNLVNFIEYEESKNSSINRKSRQRQRYFIRKNSRRQ